LNIVARLDEARLSTMRQVCVPPSGRDKLKLARRSIVEPACTGLAIQDRTIASARLRILQRFL
jgi:hypothetical protein